jgi:hypothetical protein
MDTEFLNSFIAQTYDGLVTETSMESAEGVYEDSILEQGENSNSFIEGRFKTGELDIPLILKSPSGELVTRIQPGTYSSEKVTLSQTESGKEIISKKLHDNALSKFEDFLYENEILKEDNSTVVEGDFIKIKSEFQIVDFSYLENIINPEKLTEFTHLESLENIKNVENQFKAAQKSELKNHLKNQLKLLKSKVDDEIKSFKEQLQIIKSAIEYIQDILPSSSFIKMKNILLPLKEEFLRGSSKDIVFKYGGKNTNVDLTLVGKVTKKITETELPKFDNHFEFYQFSELINYVLSSMNILNKGDYIVSPISLYFE